MPPYNGCNEMNFIAAFSKEAPFPSVPGRGESRPSSTGRRGPVCLWAACRAARGWSRGRRRSRPRPCRAAGRPTGKRGPGLKSNSEHVLQMFSQLHVRPFHPLYLNNFARKGDRRKFRRPQQEIGCFIINKRDTPTQNFAHECGR